MDLSRRNNLLYYRDLDTGTLDLAAHSREPHRLLDGDALPVPATDPEVRDRLRRVRAKALENLEERGLQTCHAAFGIAGWPSSDGGRNAAAPVLLVPVTLEQQGREGFQFSIKPAGEAAFNPALAASLNDAGVAFDHEELLSIGEEETEGSSLSVRIDAVFEHLESLATRVTGFAVHPRVVLGNFSFQKMAILRDFEECGDLMAESDVVASLAGDPSAREAVLARRIEIDPRDFDDLPPAAEFTILDADSSQQRVVHGVLKRQSGVVQGPPGTGKSQTIANLIAALAAEGKRVLFVAEKRAALEAVFKRLDGCGLGDMVLDLHGADVSRRQVAQRLQRSLDSVRRATPVDMRVLATELAEQRARLVGHVERLHAPRMPSGLSAYELQSRLIGLQELPSQYLPRWRGPALDRLSADAVREAKGHLAALASDEPLVLRDQGNAWAGAVLPDGAAAQRAIDLVRDLSFALPPLAAESKRVAAACGFGLPPTFADARLAAATAADVARLLADYQPGLFQQDLPSLARELAPATRRGPGAVLARLFSGAYRSALRQARSLRNTPASARQCAAEVQAAALLADTWNARSGGTSRPTAVEGAAALAVSLERVAGDLAEAEALLGRDLRALGVEVLLKLVDALAADTVSPRRIPALTAHESAIQALGAWDIVLFFRQWQTPAAAWQPLFECAWLRSCLDQVLSEDAELAAFDGCAQGRVAAEFVRLDSALVEANAKRVLFEYSERAVAVMNEHPDQEQLVRGEAQRRRRHLPVRTLFQRAPEVMTALCPCFMASPLSVSQLLAAGQHFDFVVFDEASQILPEDAVTSLMRGRHAVVAGDRHQLPPTQFFADDPDPDPDPLDPNADETVAPVQGFESLLDQMSGFLAPWMLHWHYRSQDDALIAFSNHHIYGDSLVTFPGPGRDGLGIHHVLLDGATRELDASVNSEVARVVELVFEHARTRPHESLGVIALGTHHADRVEAAIRQRRLIAPELDTFFAEDRKERFFIKNLERVQGDEPDAIILTLGAGKDAAGVVDNRQFGPLNGEGGQRRLNVAVTRAKRRMTLVSSFSHHHMKPARPGTGTELLRHYLAYAATGGLSLGAGAVTTVPLNPFELDVRDTLEAAGVPLVAQLGASSYRLDFAAQHPEQPGRFVLAIEADGATYHSAKTARDRDRLRQQHLERLGWRFHRIWSTDWFVHKEREVERTLEAYHRAVEVANAVPAGEQPVVLPPPSQAPTDEGVSSRRGPRPRIGRRPSITDYSSDELRQVVRWIRSDGQLRTDDQLLDEARAELSFRKGRRIDEALRRAIEETRE